jgi:hypothetical protein
MKELNVIPFSLSFLYITFNLRNLDNSVPSVNEITSENKSFYEKISLLSLHQFFQSNTVMITLIVTNILLTVILKLFATKVIIKILNGILLSVAITMFISSTIMYNSTDKKDCKITQLSVKRKYSVEEEEDKEDKEDKIKLDTFDSSIGYTAVYGLGLILLMGSYLNDKSINEYSILYILLYFIIGLLFQLVTSFVLRFFHDQKTWPSVFTYLDEFIINNGKNHLGFKIIGLIRLLLILIICIFVGYNFTIKKSFSVNNVIAMICIIYGIFTVFITNWQLLLGDGCIIDRTMSKYKTGEKKSGLIDINLNVFNDQWGKPFKDILYCSVGNQLGIYFHLILVAVISVSFNYSST